jgi:GH24 family phage-related lysozyme (muramidase)
MPNSGQLREVEILSISGYRIVGFPDAQPIGRKLSNNLDNARRMVIRGLVGSSNEVKSKLREYAYAEGHLDGGRQDSAYLVDALATMVRCGAIAVRRPSPPWEIASMATVPIGELAMSQAGRDCLYRWEAMPNRSERLHWPGGASDVTLGPGYDMGSRTHDEIVADLTDIGVDRKTAESVAYAARQKASQAQGFVRIDHPPLIDLTEDQERRLMSKVLPTYEKIVREALKPAIQVRLFPHEFDALVAFTYNVGHIRQTSVAYVVNAGNFDQITGSLLQWAGKNGNVFRRRNQEDMLFEDAIYSV